ncbi:MAG: adenosine kinase, partial [Lentisphaeria bacterium]|nr:adenosine kinase [Lentisphaeria bacterium]
MDYTAEVDESFLQEFVPGCKGGTLNIDDAERSRLFSALGNNFLRTPGGAAANTVCALGRAGISTAFFGKTGCDKDGEYFRNELESCGVAPDLLLSSPGNTGYCISLVTPDAERTMRSNLGVSIDITPSELAGCDFKSSSWLLTEGYMLAIPGFEKIFELAKNSGCHTALDISSIEIAFNSRKTLPELLQQSVDLIFCNNDEAIALTGTDSPEHNAGYLADLCGLAVIKLGAEGSLIKQRGGLPIRVQAYSFGAATDTT